jgi:hypothetical protein
MCADINKKVNERMNGQTNEVMNEWSVNNSVFFLSPHLPTFFVTLHEK